MTTETTMKNDYSLLGEPSRAWLAGERRMLIGGNWELASSGQTLSAHDPTSGEVIAAVPAAGAEDVDRAVAAARKAFDSGPWPKMKPAERERLILKLADLLEANGREFSEIESVNSGRTLINTQLFDVNLSVDYLRYMAGWATKIHGQVIDTTVPYVPGGEFFAWTVREPVGVVGAITPWNVPLGQVVWKLAPALATGCTIVLKPAEQTPLTALRLGELVAEAGVPAGVVNILSGDGETAGAALVRHSGIDKLSFTGSTEVGRLISRIAGEQMKKLTLELGGKSPVLVFDDADLDVVIPGAAMAIFANHGQNCCAGSRLYVHESIYDKVVAGVADIAAGTKLGPALAEDTEMGPLVSEQQRDRVLGYIESGRQQGAEVVVGGSGLNEPGYFVRPTVLTGTDQSMKVVREEIFGPVLVAMPFSDTEEAVARANDTEYGLGASVWTQNINRVHALIPRLRAGTVWVNTHNVLDMAVPFGGVKASGLGHELGEEAIRHHTQLKASILSLSG